MAKTTAQADIPQHTSVPRHVAIIMDGNGRWARQRGLPRFAGHKAGVEAVREVVRLCAEKQIAALTLFAFSSENWRRPAPEVGLLMGLFLTALQREVIKLHENNIRLRIIGARDGFDTRLRRHIEEAERLTQANDGMVLTIAANYGGRWDITESVRALAERVERGELRAADISAQLIQQGLCLSDLPEPDLFIRTGGEQRISNFLLWHLAYTELYFTPTLWPDFGRQSMEDALRSFGQRQRRFGRTGEQVEQLNNA